ncbi:hypothetical protein LSAT2_024870, partial [Lamellibrachia satsuma]
LQQSVNKSIQPDICTLYMFQKSSTHGWVNLIHKHIGNTGFYQCSQCPYKELSPCKVAAHFNECHPSVLDIEVKRPCLFMFCRHCDYIGYDKLSMWYHFEQYHSLTNMINANLINPASFSTQLVQMHQVALQTERVIYRCNVCDFLSQSNHNVMLHVLGQHTKDLKDNHCINNGFVQISRLDATHEPLQQPNVLSPPKEWLMTDIFVCTQCQHVTHERTLMDMHCIDNHANLFLLFVCSICGKHCDKPNKMSSHVSEAHAGFNQQSCSVTLVGSNGKEDMQLCDYTKWQNAHLAITAATSTRPSQQLQYHVSHVPITKTASQSYSVPHLSGQTKSKPVAVVTGLSSSSTGSVQKAIPTVSLLKRTPSTHVQKAIPTVSLLKRTPSTHVQKAIPTVSLLKRTPSTHVQKAIPTVSLLKRTPSTHVQKAIPTMSLLKRTPSTHLPQKRNVQAHSLKPLLSLVTNRPAQLQVISSQQQCTMQSTQQQSLVNQTNVSTLRSFVNFVQVVQEQENTLVKRQMATDQKELAQPAAKCVKLPCDVQVVHGSVHHVDLTNVDHPDDTAQHAPVQVCGTMQQLNSPTMCKQLAKNENVTESEQQAENDNLTKVVLLAESDQLTENEQSVESSQEVRYVQLPDGSVQLEIVWHFDDRE